MCGVEFGENNGNMKKKRYEWYMGTSEIIDNNTKELITQDVVELLNDMADKIEELDGKCFSLDFHYTKVVNGNLKMKDKISKMSVKMQKMKLELAEKDKIIKTQHQGIAYWKAQANRRNDEPLF